MRCWNGFRLQERMSINRSGRDWAALPPERQIMMKQAFQTLRGVPLDQRETGAELGALPKHVYSAGAGHSFGFSEG